MDVNWWASVLAGVLSGVIASFVFLSITRFLRPKILISDHLSVYPSDTDDREVIRLKIINKRFRAVSDVSVSVYAEHKRSIHDGELKVRKNIGNKFTTQVITPRRFKDKEFDNARRIRINYRELIEGLAANPMAYIVVEVYARDAVSGVGGIFTQHYALSADRCTFGSFKVGNGTEIVPYKGSAQFKLPHRLEEARKGTPEAWKL